MFGLPWSTTLIMGGVLLFWVVYTIVFYLRTADWIVEDADYSTSSTGAPGSDPMSGEGDAR